MKLLKKLGKGWLVYAGTTGYFYLVSDSLLNYVIALKNKNLTPEDQITLVPTIKKEFVWKTIFRNFKDFYKIVKGL